MAEAVGVVASVITITAVVIEGVKHVKSIYRAPEELKILQVRNYLSLHHHLVTVSGST